MSLHAEPVDLDTRRTLCFTHRSLRKMDEELDKRYGKTFFQFISQFADTDMDNPNEVGIQALASMHFGFFVTAYKWALKVDDPKMNEEKVEHILDTALDKGNLDFGDLLNHLITAHPYMEAEDEEKAKAEDEEAEESAEMDDAPPLGAAGGVAGS